MPNSVFGWFVVLKLAFEISSVGEDPLALHNLIFLPVAHQPHTSIAVGVVASAVFLAELPPTRIGVLIGVSIGALSMLDSVLPLAVVLALLLIDKPSDAVLLVVFEIALVFVAISVNILSFAVANAIDVVPLVLVVVGVLSQAFTRVVARGVACFAALWGELERLSALLLCHQL